MQKTKEILRHIPELDGIRGIAVLVVMIAHFQDPVQNVAPFGFLNRIMALGGVGVDMFFVLSGFLITSILVSTKGAQNYFRAFYARRALRIFPLYFTVVPVFFLLLVPILQHHGKDMWIHRNEQIWYWLFLSNWRHAFGYNDGAQLAHFWSLAVEEQFYLLWSLVVWFTARRHIGSVAVLVIVASAAIHLASPFLGLSERFIYFSTVTRIDALALGALLAVSPGFREFMGRYAYPIGILSVIGVCWLFWNWKPYRFDIFAADIGSCALVALAVTRSSRFLNMGWLRTFGKYSYGLYVIHYLIHGVEPVFVNKASPLVFELIAIPGGIAISFALAWVSWRVLEQPFLRLKGNFNYRFPAPALSKDAQQSSAALPL